MLLSPWKKSGIKNCTLFPPLPSIQVVQLERLKLFLPFYSFLAHVQHCDSLAVQDPPSLSRYSHFPPRSNQNADIVRLNLLLFSHNLTKPHTLTSSVSGIQPSLKSTRLTALTLSADENSSCYCFSRILTSLTSSLWYGALLKARVDHKT
jgi:hypothetical protein